MSLDATRWAWMQEIPATRKLVLLSLADRADESSVAYPSISRLSKDTCLDRKTIMTAVAELEEMGLISVVRANGSGSRYRLIGVPLREQEDQYQKRDQYQDWDQYQKRDGSSTKNGTATSTKNGTENLPIEPTNKSNKTDTKFLAVQMQEIDPVLADEFLAYRKAKKSPLTPTAWKGIQREAEKAGWSITAAVEETMTRGWQSFKADWVAQTKTTGAASKRRHVVNPVRAA